MLRPLHELLHGIIKAFGDCTLLMRDLVYLDSMLLLGVC